MKTITLLSSLVFACNTWAHATTLEFANHRHGVNFTEAEPIQFMERGIVFYVFLNGDFDFNTRPEDVGGSYYFRGASSKTIARGSRPVNYGVLIEFDSFGRVRRVGNTFINYDSRDRVSRIGSVFMHYNRFALTQIGGMRIVYNRLGQIVHTVGSVKRHGFTPNYYEQATCSTTYYGSSTQYNPGGYYYRTSDQNTRQEQTSENKENEE